MNNKSTHIELVHKKPLFIQFKAWGFKIMVKTISPHFYKNKTKKLFESPISKI